MGFRVGVLFAVLVFTLGVMTLRNGDACVFFFWIFFPILWIFGALMSPAETVARA